MYVEKTRKIEIQPKKFNTSCNFGWIIWSDLPKYTSKYFWGIDNSTYVLVEEYYLGWILYITVQYRTFLSPVTKIWVTQQVLGEPNSRLCVLYCEANLCAPATKTKYGLEHVWHMVSTWKWSRRRTYWFWIADDIRSKYPGDGWFRHGRTGKCLIVSS
jgi:hypothetical protein